MHVCEEFRECITEQLLDRQDLQNDAEIQRELLVCNECLDFYSESREMVEALSSVHFEISEYQWDAMADRLRVKLAEDYASRHHSAWRSWFRIYVPAMVAAAAILLIGVGVSRLARPPIANTLHVASTAQPTTVIMGNPALDPVTVEYLQQSELLLRSVMNLQPDSPEDVEEAKQVATRQLVALDQRKQAASGFQPVVKVMDKYETILRDIRNLNQHSVADDIADLKNRIEKNGLIADMKAVQPKFRMSLSETDLARDQKE
jgi:hypothetical protein